MASEFAEALSVGTGGRRHVDEDSSYAELLGELVAAVGSGAAAARALGVSPTTFYRWRSGRSSRPGRPPQRPSVPKSTMVRTIRANQVRPELARAIRRKDKTMAIRGWVQVSGDSRLRTVHVGREFPARVQANILDAWLTGDDDRAERLTFKAIDRYYTSGMQIDQITEVYWE